MSITKTRLVLDGVHGQVPASPNLILKKVPLAKKHAQPLWVRKSGKSDKGYQSVTREEYTIVWDLQPDGTAIPVKDGWQTICWHVGDQIVFGSSSTECYTHRMKGSPIGISLSTIVDIDAAGTIILENGLRFSYTKGEVDEFNCPVQRVHNTLWRPAHILHMAEEGDRVFRLLKNAGVMEQDVTMWFPEDQPPSLSSMQMIQKDLGNGTQA